MSDGGGDPATDGDPAVDDGPAADGDPAVDDGPDRAADRPRVAVVGAAMIDEWYAVSNLPEPDGGAYASEVTTAVGGVGANVAVGLDRLGRDVGLVSRVGDDEYGRRALSSLADTGVDASRIAVGDDATTRSVVLRAPDGERAIVTTGESFRRLRLDEPALDAIRAADVVFLTAYTPDRVARRVLDVIDGMNGGRGGGGGGGGGSSGDDPTSDAGADPPAVAFDLSGAIEELVGRGTEPGTIHRYVRRADLFAAGDVATPAYFGGPQAAVERLAAARDGVGPAVLTHGADGATVIAGGGSAHVDAFDVDVVDTTGAGDAFLAGLIDRLLLGHLGSSDGGGRDAAGHGGVGSGVLADADPTELVDGVRFAAAVAAINCTERYTQPGLPTRGEVTAFLAARDRD